MFSKPSRERTHDENLREICCICAKKGKHQNVTESLARLVVDYAQPNYQRHGGAHPTVICSGCRMACMAFKKDGPDQTRHKFGKILDYGTLVPPGPATRNSPSCQCSICQIARLTLTAHIHHNREASNSRGRPGGEVDLAATPNTHTSKVICDYCHGEKRQGVEHVCNQTERRKNIAETVQSLSQGSLEHVAGAALKEVMERQGGDTEITMQSGLGGASPLTAQIGKKSKVPRQVTSEDMIGIKKKLGLSCVQTRELAAELRVATQNRKVVESGLKEALVERNHLLEDLFICEDVQLMSSSGEEDEKVLVYCSDVDELLRRLVESRELDEETMTVKIGLDGGQGSLKVVMSVVAKIDDTKTGRRQFGEGVATEHHKLGSVHRLMVLACMADAPENYNTVKLMLDKLAITNFNYTVCSDMKIVYILLGKSVGNLTHGCIFCTAKKPYQSEGELYTLGMLRDLHKEFVANGSSKKKQADYQNVIHVPLLGQDLDPDTQVLGLIAAPELHLMLGSGGNLKTALEKKVFETEDEGQAFLEKFLIANNITRKGYQDSHSLEGNQTRMFLKSAEKLRAAYMEAGLLEKALPYIECLEALSEVVDSCFGMELKNDYEETIARFKSLYLELPISVTPKVHCIFFHVTEYIKIINKDEGSNFGLGYMSEQAFESIHSNLRKKWENGIKVSSQNRNYGIRLLNFIVAYNSNNI